MKKKIIITVSILIIISIMTLLLLFIKNDEPKKILTDDEIKFKEEYEKYNNVSYNEETLKEININSDNNVIYVNDNNILELLKNGDNVIYFGSAENNDCRSIISTLIKLLKKNSINKLYYYNINELSLKKDEKSINLYNNINSIIKDELKIKSNPTIVFVKEGNIIGIYSKVDMDNNIDFNNKVEEYINILKSNMCFANSKC